MSAVLREMDDGAAYKAHYDRTAAILKGSDFKHVYDGGHHSVYCNDKMHLTIGGGHTGFAFGVKAAISICDCENYKASL